MPGGRVKIRRSTAILIGGATLLGAITVAAGETLTPLATALLGPGLTKLLGGIASSFIPSMLYAPIQKRLDEQDEDAERRATREQNHHVQRVINLAIARCIADAAKTYDELKNGKRSLERTAEELERRPLAIEIDPTDSGGSPVDESRITALLSGGAADMRAMRPLTAKEWEVLVGQFAHEHGIETIQAALEHAAANLEARFAATLVETLKESGADSDPAWFALVLRFLAEIHAGVRQNGGAIAALREVFDAHAASVNEALARLENAVAARAPAGGADAQDQLEFIRDTLGALSRDLPSLLEAAKRTNRLLPGIAEATARGADAAEQAAAIARESLGLLQAYGFVPLVSSNVPPLPHTFVQRPGPQGALAIALQRGARPSHAGRAQVRGGGGSGKTLLAEWYANEHRSRYPGGVYKAACEGRTLAEAIDGLMPPHEGVKGLTVGERAAIVRAKLSSGQATLLILDNVESAARWREYRAGGLLPAPPCDVLITTRADDIRDLPAVEVDKLEPAEAAALLAKHRPSAGEPGHARAIEIILRETERLAALVAAVGMAMTEDDSDDWDRYAAWLTNAAPDALPDAGDWIANYTNYPHKTAAILDDLRKRLHPAALRAIDYAALLPADVIAQGWLEALLAADADPSRGDDPLDLGRDTRGNARDPAWHVQRLQERDLLRQAGEGGRVWSLHRLHRKRAHDHLSARPDRRRAMLLAIAGCAAQRGLWLVQRGADGAERWVRHEHRWELAPLHALARALREPDFDHHDGALSLNQCAYLLGSLGRAAEAEPLYEEALAMFRRHYQRDGIGDHPEVATSLTNLAALRHILGRRQGTCEMITEAAGMIARIYQPDHPIVRWILGWKRTICGR